MCSSLAWVEHLADVGWSPWCARRAYSRPLRICRLEAGVEWIPSSSRTRLAGAGSVSYVAPAAVSASSVGMLHDGEVQLGELAFPFGIATYSVAECRGSS